MIVSLVAKYLGVRGRAPEFAAPKGAAHTSAGVSPHRLEGTA